MGLVTTAGAKFLLVSLLAASPAKDKEPALLAAPPAGVPVVKESPPPAKATLTKETPVANTADPAQGPDIEASVSLSRSGLPPVDPNAEVVWSLQTEGTISLLRPQTVVDGQIMVAQIEGSPKCERVRVTWMGQRHDAFPVDGVHQVLLPVRLALNAGDQTLKVRCSGREAKFIVQVSEGTFPESKLSVDPKFDKAAPPRVVEESAAIKHAWTLGETRRQWNKTFTRPAKGIDTSPFGVRRTFNGKIEGRHRGLDIDGKNGDPIFATNDGKVVLVADDFYYIGNAVFLDHGAGLFTIYFHMTKAMVKEGERVRRGQRIGTIGKTGRVTGPHLHFGVKLADTYVNPIDLLAYTGERIYATRTNVTTMRDAAPR
ncbi:MAG: peptidoglycan DD-metalloendopeptidase family protein [Myxococcota bacterium]|nr:M23 family metallopeptidase [Myxococcota bacterium]